MPAFTKVGVMVEVQGVGQATRVLVQFNKEVEKTGKSADDAGKKSKGFGDGLGKIQDAIKFLGLGVTIQQLGKFALEAFNASAAAERLGNATDSLAKAVGSSGDAMVSAITQASNETISKTAAMSAANKALLFGIVENEDQMKELTQIAVTLGAAMGQDATKSLDDLTVALGRQSPMILDNLGITLKLEEAYRIYAAQLGKTADALTEEEKKQAFVNAALIKGRERVADLGGITVDTAAKTEQMSAAWDDFKVAFGGLLAELAGGVTSLTNFIRELEKGAEAWKWVFDARREVRAYHEEMQTAETVTQAGIDATMAANDAFLAMSNTTQEVIDATQAKTKAQQEAKTAEQAIIDSQKELRAETVKSTQASIDYTSSYQRNAVTRIEITDDERNAIKKAAEEEAKAFQETLKAQQAMVLGLKNTQASYYNELRGLQNEAAASEADFENDIYSIRVSAGEKQKEAAAKLSEELANLEQERADKIHWVMTGAHARTEAENAEALNYWNAYYDDLVTTATAKTKEQTDAVIAEQGRAEAAANAAREKEKAAMEQHLEELKLKTALSVLETTGQLEQLTGLVGVSAADAAELINAGVLPVTQQLGFAIQNTMAGVQSSLSQATATAAANQNILNQALSGTLQGAQAVIPEVERIGGPFQDLSNETLPTTTENATTFFENLGLMTDTYTQGPVTAMDTKFVNFNTLTLPTTQTTYTMAFQEMINATNELIATVERLLQTIAQIGEMAQAAAKAVKKAAGEMSEGFGDAASEIRNKLLPALSDVIKSLERVSDRARTAANDVANITGQGGGGGQDQYGAGRGLGFSGGWGLQKGLGLGWTVPSGYPNDSFGPLFVESGEQVLVTPKGSSIDSVVLDRLSSLPVQTSMTNYYFNMTVNTGADAVSVIQQYEVMRAMLPN